jgi:hypothetical protein
MCSHTPIHTQIAPAYHSEYGLKNIIKTKIGLDEVSEIMVAMAAVQVEATAEGQPRGTARKETGHMHTFEDIEDKVTPRQADTADMGIPIAGTPWEDMEDKDILICYTRLEHREAGEHKPA